MNSRRAEPTDFGDGVEYCYPEVEPKFDPEEFAALFGKPLPSLPRHPTTSEPMYCPPPEMDPRDVPKKPPRLPRPPPLAYQHGSEWPKGCSLPHAASPFLGPVKLPSAGSSPVSPRSKRASPAVPSRLEKPLVEPAPSTPPKPKPKPLPRPPPIRKRATEPVSTYGGCSEGILEVINCALVNNNPLEIKNSGRPINGSLKLRITTYFKCFFTPFFLLLLILMFDEPFPIF